MQGKDGAEEGMRKRGGDGQTARIREGRWVSGTGSGKKKRSKEN